MKSSTAIRKKPNLKTWKTEKKGVLVHALRNEVAFTVTNDHTIDFHVFGCSRLVQRMREIPTADRTRSSAAFENKGFAQQQAGQ